MRKILQRLLTRLSRNMADMKSDFYLWRRARRIARLEAKAKNCEIARADINKALSEIIQRLDRERIWSHHGN